MTDLTEIARRHDHLRAAMAAARLRAVVIAGNTEFQQKGYIRYYAGWRLHGGTAYLVVTPDREPALILGLGAQAEWAKELSAIGDTRAVLDKIGEVSAILRMMSSPADGVGIVGLSSILPHND